jgi:hypothetical protein
MRPGTGLVAAGASLSFALLWAGTCIAESAATRGYAGATSELVEVVPFLVGAIWTV